MQGLNLNSVDVARTQYTALMFQIQNSSELGTDLGQYWDRVKREAIRHIEEHGGFPFCCKMPCGYNFILQNADELLALPIEDKPCSCGNPAHWFIQYSVSK